MAIRPIEPGDRSELAAAHGRLSRESQHSRYFGAKPRLSRRDLDYLTRVDHHGHEALVAIDRVTGEGVGVARYVRTAPGVAEPAVVIAEAWRRRGLASGLLRALADRACEEGVRRFEAPVLATNRAAIRALARLGKTTFRNRGSEVDVSVELGARGQERRPQPSPGRGRSARDGARNEARAGRER